MKILKFYGEWCSPCKTLSKQLEGFSEVEIEDIDIDDAGKLLNKYEVRKLPTLVLVDDEGNQLFKHAGLITKEELKTKVDEFR